MPIHKLVSTSSLRPGWTLRRVGAVSIVGVVLAGLTVSVALPAAAVPVACLPGQVTVPIKVELQGPYSTTLGHMTNTLNSLGYLPALEPYAALGYPMRGGENKTAALTDLTSSNAPVDWLLVELRSAQDPTQIVATDTVMIGEDGLAVTAPTFAVKADNYFVAIEHRNHLGLMTAAPIAVGTASSLVDFSSPSQAVYNNTPSVDGNRATIGGIAQMGGGEANHIVGSTTNQVDYGSAPTTDQSAILARLGGSTNTVVYGYYREDLNMDGAVRYGGSGNDRAFIVQALGGSSTNIHPEQLPVGVLGTVVSCATPTITSPVTVSTVAGSSFSFLLTAVGDPVIVFSIAGALPAGVTFNPATGIVSGTSTVTGTFPLTVTASNTVGSQQQTLTLSVVAPATHLPVVSG